MGDILGLGMTHYPPLAGRDENMTGIIRWTLQDPDIPAELKLPANWPPQMRGEFGTDNGKAAAAIHRTRLVDGLDTVRDALDEFQPDFTVIWSGFIRNERSPSASARVAVATNAKRSFGVI